MPRINLPVFEGPLDLLLHLIERDDLDITAVSLVTVTDQYLRAIRDGESYEPRALAEFVSIGAKLIYLKSRALLPRPPQEPAPDLEEDEIGRELVDLLQEYRRFGAVADMLQARQESGFRYYTREASPPEIPEGPGLDRVTLEALKKIMLDVMKRKPQAPRASVPRDSISLRDRIERFRTLLRTGGRFSFRTAILECRSRVEVVVAFLAILELLKSGECEAEQPNAWGDIEVVALAPVAMGAGGT